MRDQLSRNILFSQKKLYNKSSEENMWWFFCLLDMYKYYSICMYISYVLLCFLTKYKYIMWYDIQEINEEEIVFKRILYDMEKLVSLRSAEIVKREW